MGSASSAFLASEPHSGQRSCRCSPRTWTAASGECVIERPQHTLRWRRTRLDLYGLRLADARVELSSQIGAAPSRLD